MGLGAGGLRQPGGKRGAQMSQPASHLDAIPQDAPHIPVLIDEVKRFMTMVEAHTGKPMLLLTSKRVEAAYRLSEAIPRPIWSVQDFFPPDYATRPWRMWRASDMRRVQGIRGAVHWDVVAP